MDQNRLEAIAQAVQAAAIAHFSASFTEVALDEGHDRVLCYRVPSAAFDEYLLHAFAGQLIVVLDAKFSKVTLDALTQKLTADDHYWKSKGVNLAVWGADPAGGFLDVSIVEPVTPQLQEQFTIRYAPVPVHLQRGQAIPMSAENFNVRRYGPTSARNGGKVVSGA